MRAKVDKAAHALEMCMRDQARRVNKYREDETSTLEDSAWIYYQASGTEGRNKIQRYHKFRYENLEL